MRLTSTVCSLLVLMIAGIVSADVLVSESFDYDLGAVAEQDGGEGWFEPWLLSEQLDNTEFNLDVVALERPLVYALPEGGFINGGDKALRFSNDDPTAVLANETTALFRGIDPIIDADEVFFSFLYRYDGDGTETGGFIDDNDFVVWWFNSSAGPQTGLKGNFGNGSQTDDFVGRVSGAFAPPQQAFAPGIDISEEAGTLNDDWLVVGKMSRAAHSDEEGDYDQFDLWINPALSDEASPLSTGMGVPGDVLAFELESIGLRVFSQEPGDAMIWDELRIGETWEDVVGAIGDQNVTIDPVDVPGDCNADGVVDAGDLGCIADVAGRDLVLAALNTLAGDLDGDGSVGFPDFLVLSANFGNAGSYAEGNVDVEGDIGFPDFLILSANFGQSAAVAAASVPEPSTTLLLSFGLCGLLLRRRRWVR